MKRPKVMSSANKADPIADALEALTGYEWRLRDRLYECRVNHTQSKNLVEELTEKNVPAKAEVSAARSGRYIVTVESMEGPAAIKAAANVPENAHEHPFLPKKWRSDRD